VTGSAPTFTFVSDGASASFECRFDNEAFKPCKTPLTRYGLAYGAHTFYVRSLALDDLGDSRSFVLAQVSLDRHCSLFAGPRPANGDLSFCVINGDCPSNSECWVDELIIDTTDPKQLGSGFVQLAVCRRTTPPTDVRNCAVAPPPTLIFSHFCFFPTAGASPYQSVCPSKGKNPYAGSQPPVTRYTATCQFVNQLPSGAGQVGCTVRMGVKPAEPFDIVGGGGRQAGMFAPAPGRLTVAPAPSAKSRMRAAARRKPPFTTIRRSVTEPGWVTLQPKLSRATAAALKRRRKLRLSVKVTFVATDGERTVRTDRVTLRDRTCRIQPPKTSRDGKLLAPKRVCR
jgi:hypothetical protein